MISKFNNKPSATYLKALNILQTLLKEEDEDMVTRAFAETVCESRLSLYTKSRQLEPKKSYHICIHHLKNKRCPGGIKCHSSNDIPGRDHVSEWKKDGKTHVIVSQPYDFSYETMKETVLFCEKHGFRADISSYNSWHFPGETIKIEYKRQEN